MTTMQKLNTVKKSKHKVNFYVLKMKRKIKLIKDIKNYAEHVKKCRFCVEAFKKGEKSYKITKAFENLFESLTGIKVRGFLSIFYIVFT